MKKFAFRTWTVPLALLGLCGLSYGLLAPWLGFYWDDWPTVWYLHRLGPSGFQDVFSIDRPPLGWLFTVTTALVGESTLAWQVFGLLTRWLACLALWWTLRQVWPEHPRPVAWTVFLFAVYPGFTQQFISVTYSNAWIILAVFTLSLGLMVRAARGGPNSALYLLLSIVLGALVPFFSEYFFGLELLRPLLLWWTLGSRPPESESSGSGLLAGGAPDRGRRLRQVILRWLPYLAGMAIFLYWRTALHDTPRGEVQIFDLLARSPLGTLFERARTVVSDMLESSLVAWADAFNFPKLASYGRGPLALYAAIVLLSAPFILFYLAKLKLGEDRTERFTAKPLRSLRIKSLSRKEDLSVRRSPLSHAYQETDFNRRTDSALSDSDQDGGLVNWAAQAIILGLLALLAGGIPFWVTYLPIELRFPWDRFTLAMMLGASLLLAGLLELLPARRGVKVAVLGLALSLAVGFQVQQANLYRREWNLQKAFFWQLAWRAPGLQPGTALITAELPFTYYSDNSLTAPLNWIYAPDGRSRQMPYLLYAVESRLKAGLPRLEPGVPIEAPYRATTFSGSTDQAIAIFTEPPGCLKVVDPAVDARLPQKPNYIDELLPLSDPGWIVDDPVEPARPPQTYFGPEPLPDWCYYFEKADLARQAGDWETVAALGKAAFQLDQQLYEVNAPELVPFIEGYARTGRWDRAAALTAQARSLSARMQRMLCDTWQRIQTGTSPDDAGLAVIARVTADLKCPPK